MQALSLVSLAHYTSVIGWQKSNGLMSLPVCCSMALKAYSEEVPKLEQCPAVMQWAHCAPIGIKIWFFNFVPAKDYVVENYIFLFLSATTSEDPRNFSNSCILNKIFSQMQHPKTSTKISLPSLLQIRKVAKQGSQASGTTQDTSIVSLHAGPQ